MDRVFLLVRILRKNNPVASNSIAVKILLFLVALIIGGALFAVGTTIPLGEAWLYSSKTELFSALFVTVAITMSFLEIPKLLSMLFLNSDIDSYLALPISSSELVFARLLSDLPSSILISAISLLPLGLGYFVSSGFDIFVLIALLLAVLIIPLTLFFVYSILLTIILKFFKHIRSRELLTTIGAIFGLIIAIGANVIARSGMSGEQFQSMAGNIVSGLSGSSWILPDLAFLGQVASGNILAIFLSIAVLLALGALFYVVINSIYIDVALNIMDSATHSKSISKEKIEKSLRSSSVNNALMKKELKLFFRNPAYISNGWAQMFTFSVIFSISIFFSGSNILGSIDTNINPTALTLILSIGFSIAFSLMASYSNSFAYSSISREGSSFFYMKTFAISYLEQLRAKRNSASLVSLLGSLVPLLILGVIGFISGYIEWWGIPLGIIVSLMVVYTCANFRMVQGVKKANLDWSNEALVVKPDTKSILMIFVVVIFTIIVVALCKMIEFLPVVAMISISAILFIFIVLALISKFHFEKRAPKYFEKF